MQANRAIQMLLMPIKRTLSRKAKPILNIKCLKRQMKHSFVSIIALCLVTNLITLPIRATRVLKNNFQVYQCNKHNWCKYPPKQQSVKRKKKLWHNMCTQ